jgi:hypothetical protein
MNEQKKRNCKQVNSVCSNIFRGLSEYGDKEGAAMKKEVILDYLNRAGHVTRITGTLRFHAFGHVCIIDDATGLHRRIMNDRIVKLEEVKE